MNDTMRTTILKLLHNYDFNGQYMIFEAKPEDTAKYISLNNENITNLDGNLINNGLLKTIKDILNAINEIYPNQIDLQKISNLFFSSDSNNEQFIQLIFKNLNID
jgi:hypothetical protein